MMSPAAKISLLSSANICLEAHHHHDYEQRDDVERGGKSSPLFE
jgi:hypothetical protein